MCVCVYVCLGFMLRIGYYVCVCVCVGECLSFYVENWVLCVCVCV